MATANLALRFVLELVAVGAYGYWGIRAASDAALPWFIGLAAPIVTIVAWGLVLAPNAQGPLSQVGRDVVGTAVLLGAALALAAAGQATAGLMLAVVVIVNAALLVAFGPGARDSLTSMGRPRA